MSYHLWTDGSAALNKSAGSAFVLVKTRHDKVVTKGEYKIDAPFTAPHAEVMAVYYGLKETKKYLEGKERSLKVHIDSEYVVKVINGEYKAKKYVEEFAVIKKIIKSWPKPVEVVHVNSHTGLKYNEMVDKMATSARTS